MYLKRNKRIGEGSLPKTIFMNMRSDTITAIATARGLGGIGVIRISGALSLGILRGMFRKKTIDAAAPEDFKPRLLSHGWVLDADGKVLDEVMAVYLPGPQTFSGEDTAEIHCHGGKAVLDAVLESILSRGARLAGPGEFTRRAYLNGRLDLSQAEAVDEMISAPTRQGVYLARNKLEGKLGQDLDDLRQKLDWLRARLLIAIDFPDDAEEEAPEDRSEFLTMLQAIGRRMGELVEAHERARLWREGALAVLAGEVNVGKSSLLNALLGRRRAIVSDTPGTTRDFIEESVNMNGLPVRLVDTAGLRESGDGIEAEGISLARELFSKADIVLLVLDKPTRELMGENAALMAKYTDKILVLLNKSDLQPEVKVPERMFGRPALAISAKTGAGLQDLGEAIYREITLRAGRLNFDEAAPPTLRQRHLLAAARGELALLASEYEAGLAPDLLSVRLDGAAARLEEVIGLAGTEDILDAVFSNFCIGK